MEKPPPPEDSAAFEIVSMRVFDAPRDRVFEAFGNPDHLVHWWGPKGFTNTFTDFDFRPGGAWRFTMHGPDGKDYPNGKEFKEIVKPERIVFLHLAKKHRFEMAMTFEAVGAKTRLTWRMAFEPESGNAALKNFIPGANEENFDRLEAYLATMP